MTRSARAERAIQTPITSASTMTIAVATSTMVSVTMESFHRSRK